MAHLGWRSVSSINEQQNNSKKVKTVNKAVPRDGDNFRKVPER